jgi:hypothetical protein
VTRATVATSALCDDHFHLDFLKRDLVVNEIQQFESARVRHVVAMQFDSRSFSSQFRMRRQHLSVKEEGDISVEFFLELMQPKIGAVPWTRLAHAEKDLVRFPIKREEIDHGGIRYTGVSLVLR